MRAIDVVTSNNDHWELKALPVGINQHLSCSLTGCVRIRRGQDARLAQVCPVFLNFSIYLICRDMDEPVDAMIFCTLKEHMCAIYVIRRELVRIPK